MDAGHLAPQRQLGTLSLVCGAYAVRTRVFVSVDVDSGPGCNDLQRPSQFLLKILPTTFISSRGRSLQKPPASRSRAQELTPSRLKVDVDLVLVPVTITDPMNRLVTGLDKDNFSRL